MPSRRWPVTTRPAAVSAKKVVASMKGVDMTTQSFIDRVKYEREHHEHEPSQLRESASGGWYCAACGCSVDDAQAPKLGKAPLGNTPDDAPLQGR